MYLHGLFLEINAFRELGTKRFKRYYKKNVMICFISNYVKVDFLIWRFRVVTKRVE